MSKRKKQKQQKQRPQEQQGHEPARKPAKQQKATLGGETVERRILLSATWITGTDGDDSISGTSGDDNLDGLAGNDVLTGGDGNDVLRGGLGTDSLQGGAGWDTADYSQASGSVTVDLGNGTATGADGNDTLTDIERVVGSRAADVLRGGSNDDTLIGGAGNDTLSGNGGNDTIEGGDGDDLIYSTYGDDIIDGGAGWDTLNYQVAPSAIHIDLTVTGPQDTGGAGIETISNVEGVIGSAYDDTFAFSNPVDGAIYTIDGNGGSNVIDLSSFASGQISAGRDAIRVDLGGGQSFQINYTNVASVVTSDSPLDPNAQDADYRPAADAGTDQVVTEGDLVVLTGDGSSDADGDTLTYKWVQTGGPAVTLSDPYAAAPTFTAPELAGDADLKFTLTVSDGKYDSQTSVAVHVTANDDAPTANAGIDQTVDENTLVTLDGSASFDPEAQGITYTWVQTGGPAVTLSNANAVQPTFTAPDTGSNVDLTFELQVDDGNSTSVADSVTISVGTWIEGTAGVDSVGGTAGDDKIRTFGGDDTLTGDAGDDVLDGGTGSDTVDYSGAGGSVTVDLTETGAQATGGAGTDTLVGIEGVIGSAFNDTFAFGSPVDGAVYTVDGGGGTNTIDLTNFSSSDVTFGDGVMTIDMGGGQSFQIVHSNVRDLDFGDLTATVISSNTNAGSWIGSGIFVDGAQAFRIDHSGAGDIDWSYDVTTDTFTLTDTTSTDATTHVVIQDLNGSDLTVGSITIDKTLGSLTSSVDIGAITITAGTDNIGTITVAGGAGTIGTFATTSGDMHGTSVINANVTTISLNHDLEGPLTVNGSVGSMDLHDVKAGGPLHITGSVGSLTMHDIKDTLQVDSSLTVMVVNKLQATTSIAGSVGSVTADDIDSVLTIGGDLDTATLAGVSSIGTVTANSVLGTLDFQVNSVQHGGIYPVATEYTFSGATQAATFNLVGNLIPIADAGIDQVVNEGDLVTLTGLGSSDPDGDPLTYSWVQVSGPAVVLSSATAAQPTFTAPEGLSNTSVQFQLQVNDGNASSVIDTVTITINADDDAPTADAGIDQVVDEGDLVTLTGVASVDPEAVGLTYTWVQTAGPAVTLSDPSAAQPTFTAPEGLSNTSVQFQLQVSDGVNTSSADTVSITINADNDAPIADAGIDQVVDEGDLVTLTGVASVDPEAVGLTYTWVQTAGPAVTLSDPSAAQPTFTAPEGLSNTSVQFQLQVSDGVNTSSADTVSITINADNDAPIADAGIDQVVDEGDLVTLTGVASVDPEAVGLTYTWVQTAGPAVTLSDPSAAQPTFTAPEGVSNFNVQFQLQVNDGVNTSVADSVTVTVNADNDAPTVNAGVDQVVNEGDLVTLTGAGSVDPEAQGLTYTWVQTSGPAVSLSDPNAAQPTFTAPQGLANTSVQFQLQVNDGVNISVDDYITVTINAVNDAPTADAGSNQLTSEGDLVTLIGAGSSDPEAQGLTYTWVQTAGPTVTLSNPAAANPTFTAPEGISNTAIQFELTVSDGTSISTDTVVIGVQANDDAPTANAGANVAVAEGGRVTLDGRGSSDPEGANLRYQWTQVGGPTVNLPTTNGPTLTFDAPESIANTRLDFVLTVSDGTTSSSDTVSVFVNADNDAPSVDAGQNRVVRHNESVQLTATASDPENQTLVYQWVQVGGPAVVLSGGNSANPSFTAPNVPAGGVLQFAVGVSDGTTTTFDTVNIVVAPNAGPQVAVQAPAEAVAGEALFIGAAAVDPDGDRLSYRWTQVGGPQVTLPASDQPFLNFTAPTVSSTTALSFQIDVSDGNATSTQTVIVTINPEVQAERATAETTTAPRTTTTTAAPSTENDTPTTQPTAPIEATETIVEPMPAPVAAEDFAEFANDSQFTSSSLAGMTGYGESNSDALAVSSIGSDFETPTPSTTTTETAVADDDTGADGFLSENLLDEDVSGASSGSRTRFEPPDLIVGDAGNDLELTPRLDASSNAAEVENVRWTQVSGTRLALDSVEGSALRVRLPEVFIEEELVFEVELFRGGERVVQEVTVQVQPVGLTNRSLSIDEDGPRAETEAVANDDDNVSRGFGKIWGALLAFFGAQSGRKKD